MMSWIMLYFGIGFAGSIGNVYCNWYQHAIKTWLPQEHLSQFFILGCLWPIFIWVSYTERNKPRWV